MPTANLLASTKTGRTDRQVVVGAHLDSVPECPGINDNGSGLAVAGPRAAMARLNIVPTNQVVFAFWGAEESGLVGSQFYVDSLTARQVKDTAVNLNFDMVGSPNFVRFVYDGDASDTDSLASTGSGVVENVFLDYLRRRASLPSRRPSTAARTTTPSSASGSRPEAPSPAQGDQDGGGGGRLRRHGWHRLRLVLPPGLRHDRQSVDHSARPDGGRRGPRRSPSPRRPRRSRARTRARPRVTASSPSSRARR